MITSNLSEDYRRPYASCYECENLHHCRLKETILSKTVVCSNYAAEGCRKYKGVNNITRKRVGGDRDHFANRDINKNIREQILKHRIFSTDMCKEWGIDKQRLYNNLNILKKRGFTVSAKYYQGKATYEISR